MPTKAVSAETMEIGKKGGGKHWTAEEVAARKAAAATFKRESVNITPPEYLSSGALYIWGRVMEDTKKIELLDNLDTDVLAMYCDAVDKYQTLSKLLSAEKIDGKTNDIGGDALNTSKKMQMAVDGDAMKMLQGWSRIISSCADKLGFTPGARARLVKKRAAAAPKDKFGAAFD